MGLSYFHTWLPAELTDQTRNEYLVYSTHAYKINLNTSLPILSDDLRVRNMQLSSNVTSKSTMLVCAFLESTEGEREGFMSHQCAMIRLAEAFNIMDSTVRTSPLST